MQEQEEGWIDVEFDECGDCTVLDMLDWKKTCGYLLTVEYYCARNLVWMTPWYSTTDVEKCVVG